MRPLKEEELINSIYQKSLQGQKCETLPEPVESSEEESGNSVSIFEEKENQPSMRDFLHKNSSESSKNVAEEFEDRNKVNLVNFELQKFEFSKQSPNETV